jgi:hypothetical protein
VARADRPALARAEDGEPLLGDADVNECARVTIVSALHPKYTKTRNSTRSLRHGALATSLENVPTLTRTSRSASCGWGLGGLKTSLDSVGASWAANRTPSAPDAGGCVPPLSGKPASPLWDPHLEKERDGAQPPI